MSGEERSCRGVRAASRAAAESFAELATKAVRERGRFAVALTGGSGPLEVFRLLASREISPRIPWQSVHLFWGDERCVAPRHPRSNYGTAERLLIAKIPIPADNVHRIRGELPPREAAAHYAEELLRFFGGAPRFDLIHLGMGPDGHVCSLFPFDPLLLEHEASTGVALKLPEGEWRVSLTYPVLNAARRVEFLVFGEEKRERVRQVRSGARDPLRIPAQGVEAEDVVWWTDG